MLSDVKISFEMLLLEASWQKKMYTELIFRRTPLGIFQRSPDSLGLMYSVSPEAWVIIQTEK